MMHLLTGQCNDAAPLGQHGHAGLEAARRLARRGRPQRVGSARCRRRADRRRRRQRGPGRPAAPRVRRSAALGRPGAARRRVRRAQRRHRRRARPLPALRRRRRRAGSAQHGASARARRGARRRPGLPRDRLLRRGPRADLDDVGADPRGGARRLPAQPVPRAAAGDAVPAGGHRPHRRVGHELPRVPGLGLLPARRRARRGARRGRRRRVLPPPWRLRDGGHDGGQRGSPRGRRALLRAPPRATGHGTPAACAGHAAGPRRPHRAAARPRRGRRSRSCSTRPSAARARWSSSSARRCPRCGRVGAGAPLPPGRRSRRSPERRAVHRALLRGPRGGLRELRPAHPAGGARAHAGVVGARRRVRHRHLGERRARVRRDGRHGRRRRLGRARGAGRRAGPVRVPRPLHAARSRPRLRPGGLPGGRRASPRRRRRHAARARSPVTRPPCCSPRRSPSRAVGHHVNEQWQSHWIGRFAELGFGVHDVVRPAVWTDPAVEPWYAQNTLLFIEHERAAALGLDPEVPVQADVVHPGLHTIRHAQPALKPSLQLLPRAVRTDSRRLRAAARSRLGGRRG